MKIILAPDSFKGSISSVNAIKAMISGIRRIAPDITVNGIPLSDGGEGFSAALVAACGGKLRRKTVTGPLGNPVQARYAISDGGTTGVIEMASAAGLPLLNHRQCNPLHTTTFGVGELILSAIHDGCTTIIIGAGGSATIDGGTGMLQALGVVFSDKNGKPTGRGGKELSNIYSMDTAALDRFRNITFVVAADVTNPLCGRGGAAPVFGPQKGATPEMAVLLDHGLRNFATRIQCSLHKDVAFLPGTGAAGGLAAGLHAFLDAEIRSGTDLVLEKSGFEAQLTGCDLVITGEGRTDLQTLYGKAPVGVARQSARHGVPVVCIAGSLGWGIDRLYNEGFSAFFSLCNGPMDESAAFADASQLLSQAAENVVRLYCSRK